MSLSEGRGNPGFHLSREKRCCDATRYRAALLAREAATRRAAMGYGVRLHGAAGTGLLAARGARDAERSRDGRTGPVQCSSLSSLSVHANAPFALTTFRAERRGESCRVARFRARVAKTYSSTGLQRSIVESDSAQRRGRVRASLLAVRSSLCLETGGGPTRTLVKCQLPGRSARR